VLNDNYTGDPDTTTPEWRIHDGWGGRISLYRQGQVSASTTIGTPMLGMASAKVNYHFAMASTVDNIMFEVLIGRQYTTGVYVILNVIQNGSPGAGLGPHPVSIGNTVAFSISGSDLVVTYVITTDPILTSTQFVGAKAINA
jgi:hypothetical protein